MLSSTEHRARYPYLKLIALVALTGALILSLAASAPASAAPTITEYSTNGADPLELTLGPDGNIWYTDGSYVYAMSPSGANLPTIDSSAYSVNAAGIVNAAGDIWFTDGSDIGCIIPGSSPTVTSFPIPAPSGSSGTPYADGITAVSAGTGAALWFTDIGTNTIDNWGVDPQCGHHSGSQLQFPVVGAQLGASCGCNQRAYAHSIAVGPNGNVWFTENGSQRIGEMTPGGFMVGQFPAPPATLSGSPAGIAVGADGNLWFTENSGTADVVGRLTPSGAVTEFPLPNASYGGFSADIVNGPDGNLWFTAGHSVGCMNTAGNSTLYAVPTASANPDGITVGPDGAIWFAEAVGGNIGRLAPAVCGATTAPPSGFRLSVSEAGTGSGGVSGPGFSCYGSCSHPYPAGTTVSLTATPQPGSSFSGWSGACHGTGTCTVTMNSNESVIATFTRTGGGGGVGSCSGDCTTVTVFGGGGVGVISAPPSYRCVSQGTLSIQINSFHRVTYKEITVYVNKKRVKQLKGHRHKTKIVLRKLRKHKITMKVVVNSSSWTVTGTRTYYSCS
jgi:virginiamycin B lyase